MQFLMKMNFNPKSSLPAIKAEETTKILEQKSFYIGQADSNEKQLFMTTTKCKDTEIDIYLKFNGIEMYRNFIEKQFTQMIVNPKAYDFDIEFRKGNQSESFAPVMFYYQYVTQEEIAKFSLTGDFAISFDFLKTSNTTVILEWKSPFTSSVEKVSVKYFIFKTEIINDTSTFNICDCDEENSISNVRTAERAITLGIPINRAYDNYIYITAEPQTGIKPKFTYQTLQIPKSFVNGTTETEEAKLGGLLRLLF